MCVYALPYIGVGTEQHLYRHVSSDTATVTRLHYIIQDSTTYIEMTV